MEDIVSKYSKPFFYEETNLVGITRDPFRFRCGMDMICLQGKATLSTGVREYTIQQCDELIFLSGTLLQCMQATDDFKVRIFAFSEDMYVEATTRVDTSELRFLHDSPLYRHPLNGDSWTNINVWMSLAKMVYEDPSNQYHQLFLRNFLHNYMMWLCSTIPTKYIFGGESMSHRQLLFHRFLSLVHDQSIRHHDVAYYADRLCISARYLNEIANEYGDNPKTLIDQQLIAEIKVLLRFSELSIEGISARLSFPDHSYMSRFFKKYTKLTPRDYRLNEAEK